MIAVLTDEYTGYQKLLIDNITQVMKNSGIGTLCVAGRELDPISKFHQSYAVSNSIYSLVNQNRISGIISLTGTLAHNVNQDRLVEFLGQYDEIPIVSLGIALPGFTSVVVDGISAMRQLMDHLTSDPHRKTFAFVRGYKDDPYSLERENVFRSVLQEHGHAVDESLFVDGNYDAYDAYNGVYNLLKTNPNVDAIVAANDDMALSAVRAANYLGLSIPDDIVVTGFDDTFAATQISPALTTVRQPITQLAAMSAQLLLDRILTPVSTSILHKNSKCELKSIGCELIVRGSTLSTKIDKHTQGIDDRLSLEESLSSSMSGLKQPTNVDIQNLTSAVWNTLKTGSNQLNEYLNTILSRPLAFNDTHWWSNICYQLESLTTSIDKNTNQEKNTSIVRCLLSRIRERVWVVSMDNEFELRRLQNTRNDMQLQMSSCTELEDVVSTMGRWLESLNVQRCFLIRYLEPTAIPGDMAELIHAFKHGTSEPCSTEPFTSKHILPTALVGELESGLMILNPIYAGNILFGYLLLDPSGMGLLTMDSSAQSIGNAMRNQHLIETLKSQASRLQNANTDLVKIANYDELTGLANRFQFHIQLQKCCDNALSYQTQVALLFIDLDGFKLINDTLGHGAGDQLLKIVSSRLQRVVDNNVSSGSTIARIGGDEFTVIINLPTPKLDIVGITQNILDAISAPCQLDTYNVNVSASIGIATYPKDGNDVETLVKHADIAMYQAKDKGKNRMALYTSELNIVNDTLLQMDQDMREALVSGDISMHYQPRVDLRNGKICAVEALMRWMIQTPEGPRIRTRPDVFIKIAETTGFITQLDSFGLEESCRQARAWELAGTPLLVAVNLSVIQLQQENFVELVKTILNKHSLNPALLELEITESAVMTEVEQNATKLGQLRELGIQLSIDDFGTGHSSLNYLKRLPVNNLKIDKSFLSDISQSDGGTSADAAIVRSVVALGKSMGFKLIAEGIETDSQHAFVKSLECDQAQGYLYAKPQTADEVFCLLTTVSRNNQAA